MRNAHAIEVLVVSLEEARDSVVEFWLGGEQIGETVIRDGEVVLRIDPRPDGGPWHLPAHSLHEALASARSALEGE